VLRLSQLLIPRRCKPCDRRGDVCDANPGARRSLAVGQVGGSRAKVGGRVWGSVPGTSRELRASLRRHCGQLCQLWRQQLWERGRVHCPHWSGRVGVRPHTLEQEQLVSHARAYYWLRRTCAATARRLRDVVDPVEADGERRANLPDTCLICPTLAWRHALRY
jgi:hypothetical protein